MDHLRNFYDGKLQMQDDPASANDMLPNADEDSFLAGDIASDNLVYLAGDIRANENPSLLSLNTLFVREHNHRADKLAQEHPDWSDDQLYSAARSIVEYELQQITYNEWLPHLIGDAVSEDTGFDDNVSGETLVEFSIAGFRFGQTLLSSSIDLVGEDATDAGQSP